MCVDRQEFHNFASETKISLTKITGILERMNSHLERLDNRVMKVETSQQDTDETIRKLESYNDLAYHTCQNTKDITVINRKINETDSKVTTKCEIRKVIKSTITWTITVLSATIATIYTILTFVL